MPALLECCPCLCQFVQQGTVGAVERWGKFDRMVQPGFVCINPVSERVVPVSLRLQQLTVDGCSVTKDRVGVRVFCDVQWCVSRRRRVSQAHQWAVGPTREMSEVMPQDAEPITHVATSENLERVFENAFRTQYSTHNLQVVLYDITGAVMLSSVPRVTLDELFASKATLGQSIREELQQQVGDFGVCIRAVNLRAVMVDHPTKESMNNVNKQRRYRIQVGIEAEADAMATVVQAEGLSECERLKGVGVAEQRKAVVNGLATAVGDMHRALDDGSTTPADVAMMLLVGQVCDAMTEIADARRGDYECVYTPLLPGEGLPKVASALLPGGGSLDALRGKALELLQGAE